MTLTNQPSVTTPEPAATTPAPAVAAAPPAPTPEEKMAEITKTHEARIQRITEDAERRVRELTERMNAVTGYNARQVKSLETALKTAQDQLKELNPQAAETVELTRFRTDEALRQQEDAQSRLARQNQEQYTTVMTDLRDFVASNGIDPADTRLDWGTGSKTYPELYKRVQASVAKINKENLAKVQAELDTKIKAAEARIKQEMGFDSVDTTTPGGATGDGDFKKIRDAWLAKPNDPQTTAAYMAARRKKGL